jgi:hypothetical protein
VANFSTRFASVADIGGKFATGVDDSGGKFAPVSGSRIPNPYLRAWQRFFAVLRIRIRIHRIHMILGLLDPDPSIIKQIYLLKP